MLKGTLRNMRYARLNSATACQLLGRVYRPDQIYIIPFGPLCGLKLRYDPSINFHAMLGLQESESLAVLQKLLRHFEVRAVYDVGANIGLYTLFFACVLPPDAVIYAFEPAPAITARLRDHLAINQQSKAQIVETACSDRTGTLEFYLGYHHHASSLHAEWAAGAKTSTEKVTVPTVTLDDFNNGAAAHQPPDFIKMDIEGGGTFALPGGARCFQQQRPLVLIESHTPDEERAISQVLLTYDYEAFRLDNRQWVVERAATHPQGVWGTQLLCPTERRSAVAEVVVA